MIGSRAKAARRARHTTQVELARRVGLSASMLGKLERGERHWTLESVIAVAGALRAPPETLLGERLQALSTLAQDIAPAPAPAPPSAPAPASPTPPTAPSASLDLSVLDEVDRSMLVAIHAVMADRATRMAA